MLLRQDLILRRIVDYFEAGINFDPFGNCTVYRAAGIDSFQASSPKHSAQRLENDHGLPSSIFVRTTTATHMINFRTSLRNTAVDVKYRAPLTTGIILE